jgi:hypothetical protein
MSATVKRALLVAAGCLLACAAVYSALPGRIAPVSLTRTGETDNALNIVGEGGGDVTRTFALPRRPPDAPHLGVGFRPATYLRPPSATITVVIGTHDRCTFGPGQYSDGGAIACPVTHAGAATMRIIVRGARGPLALIERQAPGGQDVPGIWVQIPPHSLSGRLDFVLTALSTTRPWLFTWPLALAGFLIATCGALWLMFAALARGEGLDAGTAGRESDPAAPA